MLRKVVLPGILAAIFILGSALEVQSDTVRFAIIGDRTGGHEDGVYGSVMQEILRMHPEFVMTVGDMIEGYTEDTARIVEEWREYLEIIEPVDVPLYHTPGNHDITFESMGPFYERFIGSRYYSVDYRDLHIVVVDNSTGMGGNPSELDKEQLKWLETDLQSVSDARTTLLFCHKPFWYNTLGRGLTDSLHLLLMENGVDAVFSGHFHRYFSGTYDGIKYTCIGSSGGGIDDHPLDFGYQFAWVTVTDGDISIAPIKAGSVLPWDQVKTEEMFLASSYDRKSITLTEPMPVSESGAPVDGEGTVVIRNLHSALTAEDTLHWDVPEGWQVEPAAAEYHIEPGDSVKIAVQVTSANSLYPVPTARAVLPMRPGKSYPVHEDLAVARKVTASHCIEPVSVDGRLDEPVWSAPVSEFFNSTGEKTGAEPTSFYFAWDLEALYVAAHCRESMPDSLRATAQERDGAVYYDDCIGLFLAPDPTGDTVYQIYINPKGVVFDQRIVWDESNWYTTSREFDGRWEVATRQDDKAWVIEARLPLDELDSAVADGPWGVNFRRKQQRLGTTADWQVPIDYSPDTYGRLVFER
jgi:hypothetical protein